MCSNINIILDVIINIIKNFISSLIKVTLIKILPKTYIYIYIYSKPTLPCTFETPVISLWYIVIVGFRLCIGFGHAYLTKLDQSIVSADLGCPTFRHNFGHRVTTVNHEL
jgi:hypothetical protein